MRSYWGIIAFLQQGTYIDPPANYYTGYKSFVGVYEYTLDREFKESFQPCVIFKDEHTAFDVQHLYAIRIWTDRPKNAINVFIQETDWICSKYPRANYLYLPLLRQLMKLNYKPPKET